MLHKKSWNIICLLIVIASVFYITKLSGVSAQSADVTIYLFWGEGCPHCETAKPILRAIAQENPRIGYQDFEIYNDLENRDLFILFASEFGFDPRAVPTIFIGERYWEGFTPDTQREIEAYLTTCQTSGCTDLGTEILAGESISLSEPTPAPTSTAPVPTPIVSEPEIDPTQEPVSGQTITLPLIGTIDLSGQSLLVSTLIISFVDGFNPCSLWVLSILLSITLQTKSRKKVLIVGGVFLLTTALLYGLFIAGVFTVLRIISFMGWIQVVVALIALGFALVNIKDYFWYKEGVSFTISDEKKPGIYQRMRGILRHSNSVWQLIGATIVFAAGIALVELTCTAGFPVIWSNILASQNVETVTFVLLLLVYMLVYLLDELGIFLVAVFTLRSTKLEEKHGRVLKLIGGVLMLTLAVVMLVDPTVMNNLTGTLIIFGIAIAATALILLLHRVVLPKFNIKVGSEK
jgi:cytochrome c biogenesis protein CcdA/thiol-disulfide isomerase/thioredoxin